MREKEKETANLCPPCISVPFVWCSHEHMIPCLKQGNVLRTALAWIAVEGHCRKGCSELQFQVIVSDMQAERNKVKIFADLCAVLQLPQRVETAAQLQPTVFCWCWCSPSSPTGAGPPPCPPPLPVFFPEKFLKHSELRPGEVHQFRKWELTPPVLLISSGAQQQCGQRSRQRCPVMMAGAGTRSLVSSSFQCQSNNLISAEQLVLDYRLSTLSSPH